MVRDILVLTFVSGGGGGYRVAFENQYHVRALQFANWSKILCTTLFGQIVGYKLLGKGGNVLCGTQAPHIPPITPMEMLVS